MTYFLVGFIFGLVFEGLFVVVGLLGYAAGVLDKIAEEKKQIDDE